MVDLDEIEKVQTDLKVALRVEIEMLCEETKQMQSSLQEQSTRHQLEIRIKKSTQMMCQELGKTLHNTVNTMNAQATGADTLLQQSKDEASPQHATLMQSIHNQLASLHPPKCDCDTKTLGRNAP